MTPEAHARRIIDRQLADAGWLVQDLKTAHLGAATGIAVREFITDAGPADYVLFVDRRPVGVIEAKREEAGETLTATEPQTERYAGARLKWTTNHHPLPFLFEATGQVTRFTDNRDPAPRSREVFHFFRPAQLAAWAAEPRSLRRRLADGLPALAEAGLRGCQVSAVTGLEASLAANRPRALVHMATGAGKTVTAITAIDRLLKFGGARRVLFLVDTRNLGRQAHQEFMAYTPPDDGRTFTELYNVQRLAGPALDPHAQVVISTIQRLHAVLSGQPLDDAADDLSSFEVPAPAQADHGRLVRYNPGVPVETFDVVVIDECHRSIYNLWKQVLDYFDAFLVGLTATPDNRTDGFFNQNIVAEYSYEDSVADAVNVGDDVWEIQTEVTEHGAALQAREWIDHRDRATRARRWAQLDDDTAYTGRELDRSVVNKSQIRLVIQAMKTAVETQIFPARKETPKTLIFAKTDSHADDIVQAVREVYDQGNAFCRKVTYGERDAEGVLQAFRNDYHPRIAVTVDMIATCTDVKPLAPIPGLQREFLCSDLLSNVAQNWLKARSKTTAGQTNLTLETCRSLPVPSPPVAEQACIAELVAEALAAADAMQAAIDKSLAQAAAQRQNILRAAFAGQLVPQDPADEPADLLLARLRGGRAVAGAGGRRRTTGP
ncbi:MAG TPA: DEAD/DEAH box helicase family protein [Aquabacterium sp.]|nr:DEAD/DEAH box helicase family protein [Aquabacterium sp.]HQC94084.1 DEAD/DEAH box helicase family protein [Aquabacterium sp.]